MPGLTIRRLVYSEPSKRRRRRGENGKNGKAHPRFVDYHANATDFLCVLLAAIGQSTKMISDNTGLTESQVMYRIMKYERDRRNGELTSRLAFRNGQGEIAKNVISMVTGTRSEVRRTVETTLEKRNLYSPKPSGVMKDER